MKQSLLRWLGAIGPWSVHPMYAEAITPKDVEAFEYLLGASVVSQAVLGPNTDRRAYFESARKCDAHLFLDPDTGVALGKKPRRRAPSYLFADELVEIAQGRPNLLTLVFDQSVARGSERQQLDAKLSALAARELHGLAYVSHACFLLVGIDRNLMKRATDMVREASRLPASRFIARAAAEHGT
ncbi:MAG: hypothetical protein ACRD1B_01440 [Thermoanaerobaculia bacterium]